MSNPSRRWPTTTHPRWFSISGANTVSIVIRFSVLGTSARQVLCRLEASVSKYDHGDSSLRQMNRRQNSTVTDKFVPSRYFESQWNHEVGFELLDFVELPISLSTSSSDYSEEGVRPTRRLGHSTAGTTATSTCV